MSEEEIGNKTRKFRDIALNSGLMENKQEFDEWMYARDSHVMDVERDRILTFIKKEVLHHAHFSWVTLSDPPYVNLADIDSIIDKLAEGEN